jgi:hypothetical protein
MLERASQVMTQVLIVLERQGHSVEVSVAAQVRDDQLLGMKDSRNVQTEGPSHGK